jgi:hypothetical protein
LLELALSWNCVKLLYDSYEMAFILYSPEFSGNYILGVSL